MSSSQQGKSVLIVDDSAEVRASLRSTYTDAGCHVVGEAENGLEAISLIEELNPELVSLDIIMPEMDGAECYHKVRKQFPKVECVFVSVLAQDIRVLQAFDEDMNRARFMTKPVSVEKIRHALSAVFDGFSAGETSPSTVANEPEESLSPSRIDPHSQIEEEEAG